MCPDYSRLTLGNQPVCWLVTDLVQPKKIKRRPSVRSFQVGDVPKRDLLELEVPKTESYRVNFQQEIFHLNILSNVSGIITRTNLNGGTLNCGHITMRWRMWTQFLMLSLTSMILEINQLTQRIDMPVCRFTTTAHNRYFCYQSLTLRKEADT